MDLRELESNAVERDNTEIETKKEIK